MSKETFVLSDTTVSVKVGITRRKNDEGVRGVKKFGLELSLRGKIKFNAKLRVFGTKNG